jgi:hypothetical protein
MNWVNSPGCAGGAAGVACGRSNVGVAGWGVAAGDGISLRPNTWVIGPGAALFGGSAPGRWAWISIVWVASASGSTAGMIWVESPGSSDASAADCSQPLAFRNCVSSPDSGAGKESVDAGGAGGPPLAFKN